LCDAFTTNQVANRASRIQGQALLAAVERIFSSTAEARRTKRIRTSLGEDACAHFAPVFGAVTESAGFELSTAQRLYLFMHLRGLLAAAIRLNIVGPLEAQSIQRHLASHQEVVFRRCSELGLDDLAQTALLHDIWQGAHDRLQARLFQS
jgi:urease accessory protein